MPFFSMIKLLISSCIIVALTDGFLEDELLEDFESLLRRWDVNYLSVVNAQQENDSYSDMGNQAKNLKVALQGILKGVRVKVLVRCDRRTSDDEFTRGAILYPISKSKPAMFIEKWISGSRSSRPLFLCSLRDASLPGWLRNTRIPFTSNVYVILRDAQQPETLTLQGVYHLHEESDQLTVDLVGRRTRQGQTLRWTFFGHRYNTVKRADLMGVKIRTVIPKVMFDTTNHGIGSFYRATKPLVVLLMEALNASMVPVLLNSSPNVGFRNASTGAWTGMIGMLQRREADFSLIGTAASAQILEEIDMTSPFTRQVFRLFIRKPEFVYSLSMCIIGFTVPMWIASCTTLALLAVSSSVARLTAFRFNHNNKENEYLDISEGMLQAIGACCMQGWGRRTETRAGYLICISTLVFGYLINLNYVSQLQAAVTAKIALLPFRDLDGLLDTGTYVPGVNRGTTPFRIAESATNGTMKRVRDVLESRPRDAIVGDLTTSMRRVCSEKLALLAWKTNINAELRKVANCTVVDTKVSIFPVFVAFGMVKGYPYRHTFNFFIRRLVEGGMVNHFITVRLTRAIGEEASGFDVIELEDVIPFLMLYAGALVVSLATLFVEIIFSAWEHRRSPRKDLFQFLK